ncbi:alpha/beta hydrolase [Sediminimonas sp.]|uniref:alpha/beta fold hydrolase n=1 Tax=Sediminimonas sp. TaxID=2823379 RepID=UPI0025EAFEFA|nr:alpha/beta hydrolase [Sediminimonas sp.]
MPMTQAGGHATHVVRMGQGRRQALLIHCSLGHAGGWAPMMVALDDLLDATAYDLPGHGRSADWDGEREIQGLSTDTAAALLGGAGPVDVIGHSFGATVALRLAVEHPALVRSLVLIEPVFFAVALADHPDWAEAHDADMAAYRAAVSAGDPEAAARAFTARWGDGREWDSLPEAQRAAIVQRIHLIEAGAPAIYGDCAGLLASGALERIAVPVLLVEGGNSPHYIAAINDGLARRIPDTRRAVIDGAGHMAPITHADAVAAQIRAFLRDHAPA